MLLVVLMAAVLLAGPAHGQAIEVAGEGQGLLINLRGGLPGRWVTCVGPCADPASPRQELLRAGPGGNRLEWIIPRDPAATTALDALPYTHEVRQGDGVTTVIVSSAVPWDGIQLIHRYRLRRDGRVLEASIQMPAGATLRLAGGDDLVPPPLPGLGALYSRATAVVAGADGVERIDDAPASGPAGGRPLPVGAWTGLRGRFWTLLVSGGEPLTVVAELPAPDRPAIAFARAMAGAGPVELRFYAGPIERTALAAVDPVLTGLLYAAFWEPLRWLSFGLQAILGFWQSVAGGWGLAIVLLSVSVKLLMWPLTFLAGRWQDRVMRTGSPPASGPAATVRGHRGDQVSGLTPRGEPMHGVSPWYPLKGLAGFFVQVPVLIAALVMLGEQFGLAGARFLWIADLSLPDRLLPFAAPAPFFGGYLNLLPVLATALTVLAARLDEEPGLAPGLRQGQRRWRYGLAATVFVLLYTFPAGMVLYWTTSNALQLGIVLARRLRPASRA